MNRSKGGLALAAALVMLLATTGCNKLTARAQLDKGVQEFNGQRYEGAIEHFKTAAALDPDLLTARLYLAIAEGVQEFKGQKYEGAIEHFKAAVALDPELLAAHLYLAIALEQLYIPSEETPDNLRTASQAIEEFKKVQAGVNSPAVALDPDVLTAGLSAPPPPPPPPPDNLAAFGYLPESCGSATPDSANQAIKGYKKVQMDANSAKEAKLYALKGIGSLYFLTREFDQSRDFYRQATEMNPNDPENYYMLGAMAWFDTYETAVNLKESVGLRIDDPYLKTKESQKACESVRSASGTKIDSGLDSFQKALALRPEYWEAMAYMTQLYVRKADIECSNQAAHDTDISMANEWNVRTLASCKVEKQTAGSSNGNSK